MKHYLFTTYFHNSDRGNTIEARRQKEYDYCLLKNMNAGFDAIYLLVEEKDYEIAFSYGVNVIKLESRPTFQDFFRFISKKEFTESINVVSNADIYLDNCMEIDRFYENRAPNKQQTCLALTRWDWSPTRGADLFNRVDSQDVWIVYGNKFCEKVDANFCMGVAGCDNRLAYQLQEAGYILYNPSKTIKTFHYHDTKLRTNNLDDGKPKETIPPPYLLLPPTE